MRRTRASLLVSFPTGRESQAALFFSRSLFLWCFAELHATLEGVCQRHRQCLRLRRRRHVCQRHLRWGQQGRCECPQQLCQMCETVHAWSGAVCLCIPQVEDMVTKIKWAFEDNLQHVSWMDAETKKAAKEKVRSLLFDWWWGRKNSATWRKSRSYAACLLCAHRQTQSTTW